MDQLREDMLRYDAVSDREWLRVRRSFERVVRVQGISKSKGNSDARSGLNNNEEED